MVLPQRRSLTVTEPSRGPRSPHPNVMLVIRFLVTGLVCLLSLGTAIIAILVVAYYNNNQPIIAPSWGSLIFLIILGLFTPIIYFGYNIFLPLMPFINYGDFLYSLFMVKIELLLQFAMCVLWVSGALAFANDLRPARVTRTASSTATGTTRSRATSTIRVNSSTTARLRVRYVWRAGVPLRHRVPLWHVHLPAARQESLNEPHFEWGRRAYNFGQQSKQQQQQRSNAIGRAPARSMAVGGAAGGLAAQSYRNDGRRSPGSSSAGSSYGSGSAGVVGGVLRTPTRRWSRGLRRPFRSEAGVGGVPRTEAWWRRTRSRRSEEGRCRVPVRRARPVIGRWLPLLPVGVLGRRPERRVLEEVRRGVLARDAVHCRTRRAAGICARRNPNAKHTAPFSPRDTTHPRFILRRL